MPLNALLSEPPQLDCAGFGKLFNNNLLTMVVAGLSSPELKLRHLSMILLGRIVGIFEAADVVGHLQHLSERRDQASENVEVAEPRQKRHRNANDIPVASMSKQMTLAK